MQVGGVKCQVEALTDKESLHGICAVGNCDTVHRCDVILTHFRIVLNFNVTFKVFVVSMLHIIVSFYEGWHGHEAALGIYSIYFAGKAA